MSITDKMYKLGQAARRLNDGSDQLNRLLSEIDKALGALMIGMEYTHPQPLSETVTHDDDGKRIIELAFLTYTRIRGAFHLAIKTSKVVENKKQLAFESPGRLTPLLEAPRVQRYQAVDVLPQLVSGLSTQVQEVVGQMERRCEVATRLLDDLQGMLEPTGTTPVPPEPESEQSPRPRRGTHLGH